MLGRHSVHTWEISFCPLTLPLPSCLLANFYSSSFEAQLKCHPLSNADTSDPGKKCNSFLHVPHCTPSLIPKIIPLGACRALQALFLQPGHCGESFPTLFSQWLQVHPLLTCQLSQPRELPALALSCFPDLCSLPPPTLLSPGERISKLQHSTILCMWSYQLPSTAAIPNSGLTPSSPSLL